MATESKVDILVSGLKGLNLQDRAEVKSLLDELVREESKQRSHANYHETIRMLAESTPSYSIDITLLEALLTER